MNRRAFSEVYQIIQYLPENEYQRIPLEKIEYLEKNMDTTTSKICTVTTDIDQIELSIDAKKILFNLYYNYIANEKQKNKLTNFLLENEKKALEITYNQIFNNKKNGMEEVDEQKNTSLAIIPEETIFTKIKNMFLNFIYKKNK